VERASEICACDDEPLWVGKNVGAAEEPMSRSHRGSERSSSDGHVGTGNPLECSSSPPATATSSSPAASPDAPPRAAPSSSPASPAWPCTGKVVPPLGGELEVTPVLLDLPDPPSEPYKDDGATGALALSLPGERMAGGTDAASRSRRSETSYTHIVSVS
jgi:hypothetical protein